MASYFTAASDSLLHLITDIIQQIQLMLFDYSVLSSPQLGSIINNDHSLQNIVLYHYIDI